jgi:hypothetical protein
MSAIISKDIDDFFDQEEMTKGEEDKSHICERCSKARDP